MSVTMPREPKIGDKVFILVKYFDPHKWVYTWEFGTIDWIRNNQLFIKIDGIGEGADFKDYGDRWYFADEKRFNSAHNYIGG